MVTVPKAAPYNMTAAQQCTKNAYHNALPVYMKEHAEKVFESAMEAPITMTHRQLFSITPEVRTQTREVLSGKRVIAEAGKAKEVQFLEAEEDAVEEGFTVSDELISMTSTKWVAQFTQDMPDSFKAVMTIPTTRTKEPFIIPDPYESYNVFMQVPSWPPSQQPHRCQRVLITVVHFAAS